MSDTCHGHLVANGNSLQEGVGGSISLVQRIKPCYINGGHSEGYIRNAGLGSVPKIANLLLSLAIFLIHQDNHYFSKGSFLHSLQVVCFTLLIAFQVLIINSQGGLRLYSQHWNIIGKTVRPSQWQNKVGT